MLLQETHSHLGLHDPDHLHGLHSRPEQLRISLDDVMRQFWGFLRIWWPFLTTVIVFFAVGVAIALAAE